VITISTNVDQIIANLEDRYKRQVPFAMALALNRTAGEVQAAIRARIAMRGFTFRGASSASWVQRLVKILPHDRATKEKPVARVVMGGSYTGDKTLMPFLEAGGKFAGRRQIGSAGLFPLGSVWTPWTPMRTGPMKAIPKSLYPGALGLQDIREASGALYRAGKGKHSRRKAGAGQLKGSARTFAVRTGAGRGAILQRFGPGKDDIRRLYSITGPTTARGRGFFYTTARQTAVARMQINVEGMLGQALRTAR
jgi:hypothetical protein